jgi:phage repressor protein C with HTH and peptisase S24 domain
MEPVYRDGDIIIVSPQASIRRSDRVVVRTKSGEIMAKQLVRRTAHKIELLSVNEDHADITLNADDVDWIARIIWASQ